MNLELKISKEKLNEWSTFVKQKLYRFVNTGPVAKAICFILIWVVATLPFDVYWLLRWLFSPETFWENLALFVGWCVLLGWVQAVFFIFGVVITLQLLLEDKW
jgi:hypothetical protein